MDSTTLFRLLCVSKTWNALLQSEFPLIRSWMIVNPEAPDPQWMRSPVSEMWGMERYLRHCHRVSSKVRQRSQPPPRQIVRYKYFRPRFFPVWSMPSLRYLALESSLQLVPNLSSLTQLETLHLEVTTILPETWFRNLPRSMRTLRLVKGAFRNRSILDSEIRACASLSTISVPLQSLTVVGLGHHYMEPTAFSCLTSLTSLTIVQQKPTGFLPINGGAVRNYSSPWELPKALVKLVLDDSRFNCRRWPFRLCAPSSTLRYLYISVREAYVSVDRTDRFVQGCGQLQALRLGRTTVSTTTFAALPRLRHLMCSTFQSAWIPELKAHPSIRSLKFDIRSPSKHCINDLLVNLRELTCRILMEMGCSRLLTHRFHRLTVLRLRSLTLCIHSRRTFRFLRHTPNLRVLELDFVCFHRCCEWVRYIPKLSRMFKHLQELRLPQCTPRLIVNAFREAFPEVTMNLTRPSHHGNNIPRFSCVMCQRFFDKEAFLMMAKHR